MSIDESHGYSIDRVVEGDTVNEVLSYVEYRKEDLMRRVRACAEEAMRKGELRMEESALLLKHYEEGLAGYTYLTQDDLQPEPVIVPQPPAAVETGDAR